MANQDPSVPGAGDIDQEVQELLSNPQDREKIVKMMKDEVSFDEEAIVRYTRARLQIDTEL